MVFPSPPLERMIFPGLLMAAPVLLAVGMELLGGSVPPWALIVVAVLPPVGAIRVIRYYQREATAVAAYIHHLTETPGTAVEPAEGGGEVDGLGIAHDLIAGIARLDRAGAARVQHAAHRLATIQAILEAAPNPLVLVDAERRVRLANQGARSLFGERMDDADLAFSLRHPTVIGAVDIVLGGGGSRTVEFTLTGPVECTYQALVKPFRDPTGPSGSNPLALLSLYDITTVKRSEQQRADFVANASHELRTPLAALIGFIETLRGPAREDQEARERFLGVMHDQSTRMARLVDDLLSLSRIEIDEHTPPTERVDVVRCVGAAIAAFELKAAARRVRLRVVAAESVPMVVGESDQVAQVLHNLISNAIKYTREQTEVTVTVRVAEAAPTVALPAPLSAGRRSPRAAPQMITVAVSDQGDGIAKTHLPRLTERFYRVDPARSRALGGTGLGLAIVKHILNRHRGRLTIESDVGKGTTFTVWLPAAAG